MNTGIAAPPFFAVKPSKQKAIDLFRCMAVYMVSTVVPGLLVRAGNGEGARAMTQRSASATIGFETGHKKKATFNLDAGLHYRLKVAAAQNQREMVDLVEEALKSLLDRLDRRAKA
jgi:hypothetical protein